MMHEETELYKLGKAAGVEEKFLKKLVTLVYHHNAVDNYLENLHGLYNHKMHDAVTQLVGTWPTEIKIKNEEQAIEMSWGEKFTLDISEIYPHEIYLELAKDGSFFTSSLCSVCHSRLSMKQVEIGQRVCGRSCGQKARVSLHDLQSST